MSFHVNNFFDSNSRWKRKQTLKIKQSQIFYDRIDGMKHKAEVSAFVSI